MVCYGKPELQRRAFHGGVLSEISAQKYRLIAPQRDAAGGQRSLFLHAKGCFYLRLGGRRRHPLLLCPRFWRNGLRREPDERWQGLRARHRARFQRFSAPAARDRRQCGARAGVAVGRGAIRRLPCRESADGRAEGGALADFHSLFPHADGAAVAIPAQAASGVRSQQAQIHRGLL